MLGIKININEKAIAEKVRRAALAKAKTMRHAIECPHCGFKLNAAAGDFPCPECGKMIHFKIR